MNQDDVDQDAREEVDYGDGGYAFHPDGMSLKDWYAGQALAGMLNSKALAHLRPEVQAAMAFQYAEAMIKVREKNWAAKTLKRIHGR